MKKTIFNLILTLFIVSCSSTKQNSNLESATLDFNNNTEVHIIMANGNLKDGRMNFPMNFNEKKIKIYVDNKSEIIETQIIDKLFYTSKSGHKIEYHNLKTSEKNDKKYLMQLAIPNGKVKLYVASYTTNYSGSIYNVYQSNFNNDAVVFYCKRDNENFATGIAYNDGRSVTMNNTFKNRACKYFSDNQELVRKIKSNEYKYSDIVKVVLEYNGQKAE